jgi:riboflavin synthase
MIDERQQYCPAFSCLGLMRGELIRHSDIVSVTFHEDNTIMNF